MRISFITCHFPPDSIGGGQIQSYKLCNQLGKNNLVTVFTRDYSGQLPQVDMIENFKVVRRSMSKLPLIKSLIDVIKGLNYVRKEKNNFELFMSFHIQLAALIVTLGTVLFKIKSVVSPRGQEDFSFDSFPKRIYQKFIYRYSSAILIQSDSVMELFLTKMEKQFSENEFKLIKSKSYLFPNGIESHKPVLKDINGSVINLIYVGRLIDYKGIEYLIDSLQYLKTPDYILRIIGDGPHKDYLEHLADNSRIIFEGEKYFKDVEKSITDSNILILPSLTENLPNVILEALSFGVPVIATYVGAIPEIIKNGYNGYLVETKNSVQIAEKIDIIASDQNNYNQLCKNSVESIFQYSWDYQLERLNKTLQHISKKK